MFLNNLCTWFQTHKTFKESVMLGCPSRVTEGHVSPEQRVVRWLMPTSTLSGAPVSRTQSQHVPREGVLVPFSGGQQSSVCARTHMNYSCRLLITKLYSIQLLSHRCEGFEVHSRACEWPQRQARENADCSARRALSLA